MNENIDLIKILKNCPIGIKLYLTLCGEVKLIKVENNTYPICVENSNGDRFWLTQDGKYIFGFDGECILFPSKYQKDWSKFSVPWYKKDKFDPKTLKPFDKVITKFSDYPWKYDIFSYYRGRENKIIACYCTSEDYVYDRCIPYNDETKHLVGTTDEAPEYYRYWED